MKQQERVLGRFEDHFRVFGTISVLNLKDYFAASPKGGLCKMFSDFDPHPQRQNSLVRISVCNQVSNGNSY